MQFLTKLVVNLSLLFIVLSKVNSKPAAEVDSSPISLQCSGSTTSLCVNEQCTVFCTDGRQVQLRCSGGSVSINSNNVRGQSSSVQAECGKKSKFRSCFPFCGGGESVIEAGVDDDPADSGSKTVSAASTLQNDGSLTSSSSTVVQFSSSSSSSILSDDQALVKDQVESNEGLTGPTKADVSGRDEETGVDAEKAKRSVLKQIVERIIKREANPQFNFGFGQIQQCKRGSACRQQNANNNFGSIQKCSKGARGCQQSNSGNSFGNLQLCNGVPCNQINKSRFPGQSGNFFRG